ncbi:MAG: RecQ family ATP-dependent DNA helicase [Pseudoflavonifractor sp.]|nr:RecQ family ATP-dependent DNA helicase [Alloprevotella sp.]MCM1116954.1 RecQ family ATP-dependent DNA helicase [Pseudoflavonifractor sp.]
MTPLEVLDRYWGYDNFRPLQADIIASVLDGHDTLGLLPTGGGKSITFQVPALMLPGLTIVVTPLISLMKDQVDNLRSRGINAAYLCSGLASRERHLALDRIASGRCKLLYVSPERLGAPAFIDELRHMNVSLIVVDEAHCISQWGYDFRPSYLRVGNLRALFSSVPILALTASATPEVADDIRSRLSFRPGHQTFRATFARPNISYIVRRVEHKEDMLLKVLSTTNGSAIVYVRSRRRTRELAAMIEGAGISAGHYHAGLDPEDKNRRQDEWKRGDTRVIVATNAFGMGIDKPDVRTVIHYDLPSSLEEYYQESGRAGRDGLPSFAVVIVSPRDNATLSRRLAEAFPQKDEIRRVYELAGNFLSIAVGSGAGRLFEFNFPLFCTTFGLQPMKTHASLHLLTQAGYIEYIDETTSRSRAMVVMDKRDLYDLRLDPVADTVLQALLRGYTGLFADYVYISESVIARNTGLNDRQVYEGLLALNRAGAVSYVPRNTTPFLIFTTSRELPKYVQFPLAVYEEMRERMKSRLEAMRSFAFADKGCRVAMMLNYFGESGAPDCGNCDICRAKRAAKPDMTAMATRLLSAMTPGTPYLLDALAVAADITPGHIAPALRILLDSGKVEQSTPGRFTRLS